MEVLHIIQRILVVIAVVGEGFTVHVFGVIQTWSRLTVARDRGWGRRRGELMKDLE